MFAPRDPDEYLLDTERRVIRLRRHWASLVWELFEAIGLLVGVVMVSQLLPQDTSLPQNVLWYAGLVVLLRFTYQVLDWYVERIVVTDKRFLIAEGIFTTNVAMMPIGKVTDLTFQRTLAGRMFGYGTLVVESAGQIQALNRIEYVPNPDEVEDAISYLVFGEKKAQQERFSMLKARRAAVGKKKAKLPS
ncbi:MULTISPECIES: PH domain-containing protein [Saccharopolyspora]|uniref:PH domain-containing protein n=1 Tax=Saccharopolyspora gregorii TaxID=33914 RepID=A0ABP6S205_9PSEU|nr:MULTISPECIES: PH domain-containing protein [Saccharopolyspora]MCA1185486.1 PH domain-containing protein [Saccharopolyspora sp. 6T]MCA1192291.1 PH domain-containing protein [Saccharopolyspora sp. 6V]MCA1225173.1 PH domain-containing protein [Saccharopolyspora sp. 6M]MCA1279588.1 PH domain-containing protein [Saccharopolyspora sp. 7B]